MDHKPIVNEFHLYIYYFLGSLPYEKRSLNIKLNLSDKNKENEEKNTIFLNRGEMK